MEIFFLCFGSSVGGAACALEGEGGASSAAREDDDCTLSRVLRIDSCVGSVSEMAEPPSSEACGWRKPC